MFIRTLSLSNAFRYFTVYVRINIISEPFRPVEKIKQFNFKLYSSNDLFILLYYFDNNRQQTLSVTRSFDSSLALYYKMSIVTMRLSCTVTEIWRLKDNGVTSLTFWGHVTSSIMEIKMEEGKKKEEGRRGGKGKGKWKGKRKGKGKKKRKGR